MNEKIRQLLDQISALEDDLRREVQLQEGSTLYRIKGKRVEFEAAVRAAHRQLKTSFFRWLVTYRPQNLLTGPIIYSMIVPLLLFDLCVSFYQATCFPIYGIRKVRRGDHFCLRPPAAGLPQLHREVSLHLLRLRQRLDGIRDRDRGANGRVFLPDQARAQDARHAFPLRALSGVWRCA